MLPTADLAACMAPEVIFGMEYGLAADMFSMGVVACEMFCRRAPGAGFLARLPQNGFGIKMEEVKEHWCGDVNDVDRTNVRPGQKSRYFIRCISRR